MKLSDIIAKGVTEEVAKEILALHQATIKDEYIPLYRFNEVNTELTTAKNTIKERDGQIEGLKKFEGDNAKLQTTLKDLQTANETSANKYKDDLATERKKNAVRISLLANETSKPHDVDMVSGLYDLSKIVLDEGGKISSGFKEQDETIRKDKAFLFKVDDAGKQKPGDQPGGFKPFGATPPDGSKGGQTDTATAYGAGLAAMKLGMLGKTPDTGKKT